MNGFLEALLTSLRALRKTMQKFPVMTWDKFLEFIEDKVNPLAGGDHVKEVMYQLQLMGEVNNLQYKPS